MARAIVVRFGFPIRKRNQHRTLCRASNYMHLVPYDLAEEDRQGFHLEQRGIHRGSDMPMDE